MGRRAWPGWPGPRPSGPGCSGRARRRRLARRSVAAFDYGYVYEVARCRWRLAEVLIARRPDATRPAATCGSAHEVAERLARSTAADGDRRRWPGAVADRRGRRGAAGHLADRRASRRCWRCWPTGNSNRQIGAALFISEKTASVHVSNILGKLDAGSPRRGGGGGSATRSGLSATDSRSSAPIGPPLTGPCRYADPTAATRGPSRHDHPAGWAPAARRGGGAAVTLITTCGRYARSRGASHDDRRPCGS